MEFYNLKILAVRGTNMAVRDRIRASSSPYLRLTTDSNTELRTEVQHQTLEPEWNQLLGPFNVSPNTPIHLEVFDHDRFTSDDPMGKAEINIKGIIEASRGDLTNTKNNSTIKTIKPAADNYLGSESRIFLKDGVIGQDMVVRLSEVESGGVHLLLQLPINSGTTVGGQNDVSPDSGGNNAPTLQRQQQSMATTIATNPEVDESVDFTYNNNNNDDDDDDYCGDDGDNYDDEEAGDDDIPIEF
ncbi:hypothetical protein LUZ60_010816 [Juncus effusus]|nr:hypothetical protein LUZ60_010816 [Juncus effusus]